MFLSIKPARMHCISFILCLRKAHVQFFYFRFFFRISERVRLRGIPVPIFWNVSLNVSISLIKPQTGRKENRRPGQYFSLVYDIPSSIKSFFQMQCANCLLFSRACYDLDGEIECEIDMRTFPIKKYQCTLDDMVGDTNNDI